MGSITRPYSEVSGTIAYASSVNRVIDDLYTEVNGQLNSANIDSSGVDSTNIQTSSVITRIINDSAVTPSKIDGSLFIMNEVFS